MLERIKLVLKGESGSGMLLLFAAFLALVFSNFGFLKSIYDEILHFHIVIGVGSLRLDENFHFWVNDALMALFFFTIGLELKKEMLEGQLRHISQVMLPCVAALGGVMFPAIIFALFNYGDEFAVRGWAIPTATDIAFAVGVIALLGKKVPNALKIFVLTLAIVDDLAAIVIIALFYSSTLNFVFLLLTAVGVGLLVFCNKLGVNKKYPYIIITIFVWACVLNSGIHATIAGVVCAFTIPLRLKDGSSMSEEFGEMLGGFVNYVILPLFAFTNAGVSFKGMEISHLFGSVPMGIMCGLFFGKQIGIFLFSFILIKLKLAYLPDRVTWFQLYAVCIICGIGFTMSLFVDALAYGGSDMFHHTDKLAILLGSIISGTVGYFVAKLAYKKAHPELA